MTKAQGDVDVNFWRHFRCFLIHLHNKIIKFSQAITGYIPWHIKQYILMNNHSDLQHDLFMLNTHGQNQWHTLFQGVSHYQSLPPLLLKRHMNNWQLIVFVHWLDEAETYINDEVSEGFEAVRLLLALAELPSVFDQEQSQALLLLGHLQSEVHFFHLLWTVEQSSQDGHGFGRVVFSVLPHSLHLINSAIWW